MKNILFAIISIALGVTACSKKQPIANDTLPDTYNYYCNGQQVFYEHDITNLHNPNASVVITDQLNGKLSYYHFDNIDMAKIFISSHAVLYPLQVKIKETETIRAYAERIDEDAYVATHGQSSETFTQYLQEKQKRGFPIILFNNTNFAPAPGWAVIGATPVLAAGINNLSKSVKAVNNAPMAVTFWDGNNFSGGSFFGFANNIPNLGAASNKISSVN